LCALTNFAGGAGGFKLAEEAISKIDESGKFRTGGSEEKVRMGVGFWGFLGAYGGRECDEAMRTGILIKVITIGAAIR
jgi:hypothetical protein